MCQRPSGLGQANGSELTYNHGNTNVALFKNGNNASVFDSPMLITSLAYFSVLITKCY